MTQLAQRANEAISQLQLSTNHALHYVMFHLPEVKVMQAEEEIQKVVTWYKNKVI